MNLGFGFLDDSAGFPLPESPIEYDPSDTFARAFAIGILNTLKVALIGIVLATLVGVIVGIARLSTNWLVRNIANVYIEIFRNIPLLVLLFFWFTAVFQRLPPVEESIAIGNTIFMNQRGIYMVWFDPTATTLIWVSVLVAGLVLAVVVWWLLTRWQLERGHATYPLLSAVIVLIGLPTLTWFLLPEPPFTLDVPTLGRFNYTGGTTLTTSFAALLVGLVLYTAAFIAEIVRAGIQAVPRGQVEAARSLGLTYMQSMRLVIMPQALRIIIPPLISQYLNLTKNSSLAVAIGYPDLFFVGRTIINQAGRAVSVFAMIMAAYLLISLTYSVILNLYNRRIRLVER